MMAVLWWVGVLVFFVCAVLLFRKPFEGPAQNAERVVALVTVVTALACGWMGISALIQSGVTVPCPYTPRGKLFLGCGADGSFRQVPIENGRMYWTYTAIYLISAVSFILAAAKLWRRSGARSA